MIAKEEAKEKVKSKLRRKLGLNDEVKNKIINAVKKTFGTKLPSIANPKKYRLALQKAFEIELK